MIDPKTAWAIAKAAWNILKLLLKCTALIGVIYFALFTDSYILPFFIKTGNVTAAREAKTVYLCCYVVVAFLTSLVAQQLVGVLRGLCPGGKCCSCGCPDPEAAWSRALRIALAAVFLGAILFGTLYPLVKALAWTLVFSRAEREDLERQAEALVVFMAITLAVGLLSLIKVFWALIKQCWRACARKRGVGGKH